MPPVDRAEEIEYVRQVITAHIHKLAILLDPSIPGVFVGQADFFAFCNSRGILKTTAGKYWNSLFRDLYEYLTSKNRPLIICRRSTAMVRANDRFRYQEDIIVSVLSLRWTLGVLSDNCVEGFGGKTHSAVRAWIEQLPDPPDLATL